MSIIEDLRKDATLRSRFERNRFLVLLGGVLLVSGFLVSIAMSLYYSSGAAQLDLSGARYVDVRDKVVQDKSITSFPSSGAFDTAAFNDFYTAYDEHSKAIGQVNGFDAAAVNNDSFNLKPVEPTDPATAQ